MVRKKDGICICTQQRLRSTHASAQSDQSSQATLWVADGPKRVQAGSEDSDAVRRLFVFVTNLSYGTLLNCDMLLVQVKIAL